MMDLDDIDRTSQSPRIYGAKLVAGGLAVAAVGVALALAIGGSEARYFPVATMLGWVFVGYGMGKMIVGDTRYLRVVCLLLAVLVGFAGTFASAAIIMKR